MVWRVITQQAKAGSEEDVCTEVDILLTCVWKTHEAIPHQTGDNMRPSENCGVARPGVRVG